MERRRVLQWLAALTAATAGCANTPRPTPQPPGENRNERVTTTTTNPIEIPTFSTREGPNGNLVVDAEVQNPGEQRRSVVVQITHDTGTETVSGSAELVVGTGETRSVSVELPVEYDTWSEDRNLDFDIESQPV